MLSLKFLSYILMKLNFDGFLYKNEEL